MSFLSQPITLQSVFGTKRMIGSIEVQVIISEETNDTLSITKQPVQTGAPITDHSFKEPTSLSMRILQQNNDLVSGFLSTFSGNGLSAIYSEFLKLQTDRTPFDVITKKRIYKNMLIAVLRQNTDKQTENILSLEVQLQEVILVSIGVAQIPKRAQRRPKKTQGTQNLGRQSAALKVTKAINPAIVGVSR